MQPEDLKAAREALGMTQQGYADALGMSRKAVNEMEKGVAKIERRTERAADAVAWAVFLEGRLARYEARRARVQAAIARMEGGMTHHEPDGDGWRDVTSEYLADKREELLMLDQLLAATRREWVVAFNAAQPSSETQE